MLCVFKSGPCWADRCVPVYVWCECGFQSWELAGLTGVWGVCVCVLESGPGQAVRAGRCMLHPPHCQWGRQADGQAEYIHTVYTHTQICLVILPGTAACWCVCLSTNKCLPGNNCWIGTC